MPSAASNAGGVAFAASTSLPSRSTSPTARAHLRRTSFLTPLRPLQPISRVQQARVTLPPRARPCAPLFPLPAPARRRRSAPPLPRASAADTPASPADPDRFPGGDGREEVDGEATAAAAGGGGGAVEGDGEAEMEPSGEGVDYPARGEGAKRPAWAPDWLPDLFLELPRRPLLQLAIMLPLYALHMFVFSTKGIKLPAPIVQHPKKLFQSIGWDSIVGVVVSALFMAWRMVLMGAKKPLPKLLESENPPWKVPREAKRKIGQTTAFLVVAYLASGYGAVFIEGILFLLAGYGVPLTIATTRAWKVLLGHLMWVYMGIRILQRLKPFFPPKGTWLRWKLRSNWLWWAIGGYYVSGLFFNCADFVNQLVLPASLFEEENVVSKLINPEGKDRMAMAIGSIGPCITAPVFEEVLYRGFLLPALGCFLPMWAAIPASSVLFALHHLNPTSVLPLTVLGLIWAILYTKSRNLTVTILIHCMWNSRVFLGSLLGLGSFHDFE